MAGLLAFWSAVGIASRIPNPASSPSSRRRAALSLPDLRRSLAVLASTLFVMTRNAEGLQIRQLVRTAIDQGNPVVELPERLTRHKSLLPHPSPHAAPLEAAAQRVGIHVTQCAHTAVAFANAPPQLARIRRFVGRYAGGMPAAAAVE